jgi:hypothetical protein
MATTVNMKPSASRLFVHVSIGECFIYNGKLFMKIKDIDSNKDFALNLHTGRIHSGMHQTETVQCVDVEINVK